MVSIGEQRSELLETYTPNYDDAHNKLQERINIKKTDGWILVSHSIFQLNNNYKFSIVWERFKDPGGM